ncbi:hypothetical protein C8Q79DRAFT_1063364 [Trametes meyenii]|nr:hypothetical protein C8Q79DRAFT_1063364 [Trametes meyenii]
MSSRGRSLSPRPLRDEDVDMDGESPPRNPNAKVVVVTNLSRNVVEAHLQTIFGFYGEITKVDLPLFAKSGQNRGKAAIEYADSAAAQKAVSHMDGGQLDGAILKCELSELPVRSRSRSRSRSPRPPQRARYGRGKSISRSPSRSKSPPPPRGGRRGYGPRYNDDYRRPPPPGRRPPPPPRNNYPRYNRSRTRSRSPPRRGADRIPPRRRSPSYERGGAGYRGRSRSYSVASSRSRTRSLTPRSRSRSRTRSRSRSFYSSSAYSRSRSRSRSRTPSRGRRSFSRDDIRDSRSRSPRD